MKGSPNKLYLSRWNGKKIRVAFRHVLMAPTSFGNRVSVFIDKVRISGSGVTDLSVTSIESPRNHCSGSQMPAVKEPLQPLRHSA